MGVLYCNMVEDLSVLYCSMHIEMIFPFCLADVGTAAQCSPHICLTTVCYSYDQTQFPSSNLFAAARDGIWDNGASCGRQYLIIQVKIVDYAPTAQSPPSAQSTTIVMSETAFSGITNLAVDSINIEFQQ
ncbi:hypothetical protein DITRI_Ditri07aG0099800 [Diplodiscus trichospermus]